MAKRAVDCALVVGFGAAYGAARLMRLGWLQFFFKPEDARQLLDWFTLIVDPAGRMPFYFYDIPAMTGVTIDTHEFVRLAQETLPGFAGVKYSNQNVDR